MALHAEANAFTCPGKWLYIKNKIQVNILFFAGISLLFLACALLGGIASVRSVAKIDPVEAIG